MTEAQARQKIDALLQQAGWIIQDMGQFDRTAGVGVAVREFSLPAGPCDYLLFVEGKAAGVIEAKKSGVTLSGVAEQSARYMTGLPPYLSRWSDQLIFDYESTGDETFFRDMRDPAPRSRRVFAFHTPHTLLHWLTQPDPLRARLRGLPPLDARGLRDCQREAIAGLERSLADDKPRSLIQMATGAGKTFTACTLSHRLITYGGAQRILFLVDRNNLGDQTLKEFQNYQAPGAAHRFTATYIVQHLQSNRIDPDAKVVITTIQRLYALLRGQDLDPAAEDSSGFETWEADDGAIRPVSYSRDVPIEMFDFIITDECHRSIYGVWRQVLEYFDAFIIGLTATPSKHTLAFFNQNLVAEYPYERSVTDGVNVGYEVYSIRTRVTQEGGTVESANYHVPVRDRRTRKLRYQRLDADLDYTARDLDRSVTVPDQIRAVIQCYRDKLFTELFPGRSGQWVPKTLIFAKDDHHAEEIVHITREVFNEGNAFCKKITYNTSEDPKTLIKAFRVDPFPRIAVTVDMIATGTDIKPVEVVLFMRDVRSEGYYEQMKGRGVRTIADADLLAVTPDAQTKTRFLLIDAVGVTEGKKNVSQPLERKRTVRFDKLLGQVAQGRRDADGLSSLAGRLAVLDKKLGEDDRARIGQQTGGPSLRDLANGLLDAIDPDTQEHTAQQQHGPAPTPAQVAAVAERLTDTACAPFNDPALRTLLQNIHEKADQVLDVFTLDTVRVAAYDLKDAQKRVDKFRAFIEDNKDELTALQILYNQPYGKQRLTYAAIKELTQRMTDPPYALATADVWQAYKRLDAAKVRGAPVDQQLTEIVSLVCFALGLDAVLEPFGVRVEQRFNLWIGREKKQGRDYSPEQLEWLQDIARYIAANAEIGQRDLMENPPFADKGGVIEAQRLFGTRVKTLLDDLQEALVA
jgi:type I restriction enzyme, R subunit